MPDSLVIDATQRLFRELGDPQHVRRADPRERLWRELESAGLARAWVDERFNGSGASVAEGFEILRIAGMHAVCVPLAETMLGSWLLARSGIEVPNGAIGIAGTRPHDLVSVGPSSKLSGEMHHVAFARDVEHIAMIAKDGERWRTALVATADCKVTFMDSVAGEPSDTLSMLKVTPLAWGESAVMPRDLQFMGATARAVQIAGALQTVLDLSTEYANERVAFERPIGKFQAIQHSLAKLAGEVAAAMVASGSAADAVATATNFDDSTFVEVASAKIRTGEAVTQAAAIAHQVHGAIGFSREHVLHRFTQRLWSWRDDFGTESDWAVELGRLVAQRGADELWPMLAER
jgi:acyl-CoA dehydrogenase